MAHLHALDPADTTSTLPVDGPFTTGMAREAGLDKRSLRRLVDAEQLRRVLRGVYVVADVPDTLALRAAGLRLVVPPGCFVTDRTAAWLHGADMALAPGDHLQVPLVSCFRPSARGRLRNSASFSGERDVRAADLVELHGLLVTTPIRTAWDLGRLRHRDQALAGMDQLLRLGDFTREELLAGVERFRRHRGVVQLRHLTPLVDPGAQSPPESALRLRWYDAGLPRPTTQLPVEVDGHVFYLDLGLEECRLGAEYDGAQFHTSPDDVSHDRWRRSVIRGPAGWEVETFVRDDVYGAEQDADLRLRAAYARARDATRPRRPRFVL